MDFTLLFISMALSSAGAFLDNYTTRIFIRDLGTEFEANKRVRNLIKKHGYKGLLRDEALVVIVFGIADSLRLIYSSFILFGLVFLIARGLTAADNLQKIVEYRTIGIDAYKEKSRLRIQAFQKASLSNVIKYVSTYLVEALICLAIYVILFTVDFPFVILSRYLIFALASFFILTAYYLSKRDSLTCLRDFSQSGKWS